jgi:hypothetical protein
MLAAPLLGMRSTEFIQKKESAKKNTERNPKVEIGENRLKKSFALRGVVGHLGLRESEETS